MLFNKQDSVFEKFNHDSLLSYWSQLRQDISIPCNASLRDNVLKLAAQSPYARLFSRDFTVSERGDAAFLGSDAKESSHHQEICGAVFGEMTDEVLSAAFNPVRRVIGI